MKQGKDSKVAQKAKRALCLVSGSALLELALVTPLILTLILSLNAIGVNISNQRVLSQSVAEAIHSTKAFESTNDEFSLSTLGDTILNLT